VFLFPFAVIIQEALQLQGVRANQQPAPQTKGFSQQLLRRRSNFQDRTWDEFHRVGSTPQASLPAQWQTLFTDSANNAASDDTELHQQRLQFLQTRTTGVPNTFSLYGEHVTTESPGSDNQCTNHDQKSFQMLFE
jgi:hypothetical protein